MNFNDKQKLVLENKGNSLVIGGPGTGKTMVIVAKVKQLLAAGVNPETIAIVCFNPKNANVFRALMLKFIGNDAKRLKYSTFRDLASAELKNSGSLVGEFADNSQMRRLLYQAKRATSFKGSIHEAEHIVRTFKAQAKKPQTSDEFYDLFSKYQDLLHNRNWYDRYDCLRQHLIAVRNDVAQPARIKHMFIDCAQDMNQIQLLWALEHTNHGIKLTICIDDDQCIFQRSGALGSKVIDTIADYDIPFQKIILEQSYRLTENIKNRAYKIVSLADQRYSKGDFYSIDGESTVEVKQYNSRKQELESLVSNIRHYFKSNLRGKVAVITRNDEDAHFVSQDFANKQFQYTALSRDIWEMPGAIVVIDMLEIILGTATNPILKNVLSTLGLSIQTIDFMFEKGLTAHGWLQNGAKIDKSLITDEDEQKKVTQIQSMLISYYNLRLELSVKDIFKALCFELMRSMSPEDKKDALYAIEKVLSFKGNMKENIDLMRQEKKPNPNSQLTLGPVREFRNMEFDVVFIPFADGDTYPYDYKVLGKKNSSDRRIFFTALTRAKSAAYVSYTGTASGYLKLLTD